MTGKERIIATLERRSVDRIPVWPVVTAYVGSRVLRRPYVDFVLNPMLVYEGYRAMIDRFKFDGIDICLGPPADWESRRVVIEIDGITYLADPATRQPFARLQDDDEAVPVLLAPPIKEKRDLDKIGITTADEFERMGCLEPVRAIVREVGESVFLAGCAASQTMNSLTAWRGSEQAMIDLREDPVFVMEAMEKATAISIEIGKALIRAGCPGIYIGDAWASASIISPRDYERFCQPFHAKAASAFHEMGAKVHLHICGNSAPILELMADTGVDAIEPLDLMDTAALADAKRRVGDRVCLKGGVSTSMLLNGSADEVYEKSREIIRVCGPDGYILGSSDDIPRDAPFANIDAMVRAAFDAGSGRKQQCSRGKSTPAI